MSGHNGLALKDIVAFKHHRKDLNRSRVPLYRVVALNGDNKVVVNGGSQTIEARADDLQKMCSNPLKM